MNDSCQMGFLCAKGVCHGVPRAVQVKNTLRSSAQKAGRMLPEQSDMSDVHKYSILIVDDEPATRRVIAQLLEERWLLDD